MAEESPSLSLIEEWNDSYLLCECEIRDRFSSADRELDDPALLLQYEVHMDCKGGSRSFMNNDEYLDPSFSRPCYYKHVAELNSEKSACFVIFPKSIVDGLHLKLADLKGLLNNKGIQQHPPHLIIVEDNVLNEVKYYQPLLRYLTKYTLFRDLKVQDVQFMFFGFFGFVHPRMANYRCVKMFVPGTSSRQAGMYGFESESMFSYRYTPLPGCEYINVHRKPHEEYQYLDLVRECLGQTPVDSRLGKCYAVYDKTLQFSLMNGKDEPIIPACTTRKQFFRNHIVENTFFLSGNPDITPVQKAGVKIWNGDCSAEALKKSGKSHIKANTIGKGYPHQWRKCRDPIIEIKEDSKLKLTGEEYTVKQIMIIAKAKGDQMTRLIHGLITNPTGRRHILCSWNAQDLDDMSLPACHCMAIFNVVDGKFLHCNMTQRSADLGLGLPHNIIAYAMLTHLIAERCGYKARQLTINVANLHIYEKHLPMIRKQLKRSPFPFPLAQMVDNPYLKHWGDDYIRDYLLGAKDQKDKGFINFMEKTYTVVPKTYLCHPPIKMELFHAANHQNDDKKEEDKKEDNGEKKNKEENSDQQQSKRLCPTGE